MSETTETVPQEPKKHPLIEKIMHELRTGGDLDNAEKKAGEALTETGAIYKRIEKDHRGNRAAVSIFRRLQKMSGDKRADVIRTLEPLLVEAGYTLEVIDPEELPLGQQAQAGQQQDAGDDGDDDEQDDDTSETEGAPEKASSGKDALASARARLAGGRPRLGIVTGGEEAVH